MHPLPDLDFENVGTRQMAGRVAYIVTTKLYEIHDGLCEQGLTTGYWQYRDESGVQRLQNPNAGTTDALLRAWQCGIIHDLTFGIPMRDVLGMQGLAKEEDWDLAGRISDVLLVGSLVGFLKISDNHDIILDGDVLRHFQAIQHQEQRTEQAEPVEHLERAEHLEPIEHIPEIHVPTELPKILNDVSDAELERSRCVYDRMRAFYGDIATRMDTLSAHVDGVLRHCIRDVENRYFDPRWKPLKIWLEEHSRQHQLYGQTMMDNGMMNEALLGEYYKQEIFYNYDESFEPIEMVRWHSDVNGHNENMLAFPIPKSVMQRLGPEAVAHDIAGLFGQGNYGPYSELNLERHIEFLMPQTDSVGFVMIPGRFLNVSSSVHSYITHASELIGLGEQASGELSDVLKRRLPDATVTARWMGDYDETRDIPPSLETPDNHMVRLTVSTDTPGKLTDLWHEIVSVFNRASCAENQPGVLIVDIPLTDMCNCTQSGVFALNDAAIASVGVAADEDTRQL